MPNVVASKGNEKKKEEYDVDLLKSAHRYTHLLNEKDAGEIESSNVKSYGKGIQFGYKYDTSKPMSDSVGTLQLNKKELELV